MQDVVTVFWVSSGDSIFDDYRSKDGDDARIYTIGTEMSNLFGTVRRVFGGRGVEHNDRASGASAETSEGLRYNRTIMTSVDFTRVATVWHLDVGNAPDELVFISFQQFFHSLWPAAQTKATPCASANNTSSV